MELISHKGVAAIKDLGLVCTRQLIQEKVRSWYTLKRIRQVLEDSTAALVDAILRQRTCQNGTTRGMGTRRLATFQGFDPTTHRSS